MYKEVYMDDIINNLSHINLIDIRSNYMYIQGTIENAINIDGVELCTSPDKYLDKEKEYYLFCNTGSTSKSVCIFLSRKGYNLINIIGGYSSFRKKLN